MKYCAYTSTAEDGATISGVCHKSKLEFLVVPGSSVAFNPITDEHYAKLVDGWGGVEIAPAKPVEPTKKTK